MPANSILKLKIDNTEYDANIKKAAEGIQHLAKRMHDAQGDFEGLDKASIDFIKDLQYMTTSAKTASGQYRELENAYKNLAATYEGLNAFEKEGDAGKALAEQLEILKKRTLDMKANIDAASQSLQANATAGQEDGSVLSQLASKFTVNIDAIKLFNIGLQAAEGALSVAQDAFFASEANVDEWGRTIQSAKSVYEGFLTSINNGDISRYLSNIDNIVKAARLAYDELDKLGSMKTIQTPQISNQQTENERIRMMIQTGRYIAPLDGRSNAVFNGHEMQNGEKLTPGQIRYLEQQLQDGIQNIVKLVGNEVDQTSKAIDAYYNSLAKQNGMSLQEFKKGTSTWEEFSKMIKGYEQFQQWRKDNSFTDMYGNRQVREGNPFQEYKKWGNFRVDQMGENSYNDLVRLIQQRDQQAGQAYSMQSQAYRTMNRAEGVTLNSIMGRGGTGGKNGKQNIQFADDSIMAQEKLVQELTQKWKTASDDMKGGYLVQLEEAKKKLTEMTAVKPETGSLKDYQEQLKATNTEITSMREELLRMKEAGEDPWEIQAKEDSLNKSIGKLNDIQNKIDYLNGKDVNLNVNLTAQDDTDMGASMVAELENSFLTAAQNLDLSSFTQKFQDALTEDAGDMDLSEYFSNMKDSIAAYIDEEDWPKIQLAIETGDLNEIKKWQKQIQSAAKSTEDGWKQAASAVSQLGGALAQIEDPGVKAAGTVLKAIADIALGFAQASVQASSMGPWGWVAFLATGAAAMTTAISTIHSVSGFANGGIIPGNSMSGDNMVGMTPDGSVYGLNAQEVVLNRAQVGNLASQLEGGGLGNLQLDTVISGEEIRLVLNNNGRRTGRGEYVQSINY